MQRKTVRARAILALALAASLPCAPAFADKPSWAGGGRGDEHKHKKEGKDGGGDRDEYRRGEEHRDRFEGHFDERRHVLVREYYSQEFRGGNCPPGLAKKHNGCMPPGQAKKWQRGYPLPVGVVRYDLPPALVIQLGVPPSGYKYVRVASDILMVAVGSGMVVDAIEDLGRM